MITKPFMDRICILLVAASIALVCFAQGAPVAMDYPNRVFSSDRVHEIDIRVPDEVWEDMLVNAIDEEYVLATLVIDGERYPGVGLRPKGNNSKTTLFERGLTRFSWKVEFDHYVKGMHYHGLDKMALNASYQDNSYLKDFVAYDMTRHMGEPAPLLSFAQLSLNGAPIGLYQVVEEIEDSFALRNYGARHGKLYKPDYRRLRDENRDVALRYSGDELDGYDNIFRHARTRINDRDKRRLIRALKLSQSPGTIAQAVDIDHVLPFFAVQVFAVNTDGYLGVTGHNYFLYEHGGRLSMLPWDFNLAFATYSLWRDNGDKSAGDYVNFPIDTPGPGETMVNRPMFHNLMQADGYFVRYHEAMDELISGYFESGIFGKRFDEMMERIKPYVLSDTTRFCSYGDFLLGARTLKRFCLLRAQSVRGQLDGDIPSTIRGQERDQSARVNACGLDLHALGDLSDLDYRVGESQGGVFRDAPAVRE